MSVNREGRRSSSPASETSLRPGCSPKFREYRAEILAEWRVVMPVLVERPREPRESGARSSGDLDGISGRILRLCLLLVRAGSPPEQAVQEFRTRGAEAGAFLAGGRGLSRTPATGSRAYGLLALDRTSGDLPTDRCASKQARVPMPNGRGPRGRGRRIRGCLFRWPSTILYHGGGCWRIPAWAVSARRQPYAHLADGHLSNAEPNRPSERQRPCFGCLSYHLFL